MKSKYPLINAESLETPICDLCTCVESATAKIRILNNEDRGNDDIVLVCLKHLIDAVELSPKAFVKLCNEIK